jgi:hypothetical protein
MAFRELLLQATFPEGASRGSLGPIPPDTCGSLGARLSIQPALRGFSTSFGGTAPDNGPGWEDRT